jgi:hypothetical protein
MPHDPRSASKARSGRGGSDLGPGRIAVTVVCDRCHRNITESSSSVVVGGGEEGTMEQNQQQALLKALKLELEFCQLGGYKAVRGRIPALSDRNDPISVHFGESPPESRKELSVFRDSPSCLNYGSPVRERPCSECWLMDFVPAEKRGEEVPCHHIPLNERGDTVTTLGGPGDAPDVQEAVLGWLHRTIQQFEGTPAKSKHAAA